MILSETKLSSLKSKLVVVFILFFYCVEAQHEISTVDEKALITKTIETYFEGWMTGDTSKLGEAMHQTCQLKNVKDGKIIVFDRATYLGFFKPRPRRKNAGGRIIDIDITGIIAEAKCEIETTERLYTDYFNMMKVDDKWYIVDKVATNWLKTKDGFYAHWNTDLSQKRVRPSMPVSSEEAKFINCYYVKWDDQKRMSSVKYFLAGKPSNSGNYGAFEMRRIYKDGVEEDRFFNTEGKPILTSSGVGKSKYTCNDKGFWLTREFFDLDNNRVENDGVSKVQITRNEDQEANSWVRYNLKGDTVPFYNQLKHTTLLLDNYGQMAFMQNRNKQGKLKNGPMGVAEVAYKYDENGIQLSKEFHDQNHLPIMHPTLKYSRIEYRDFNRFGLPQRFYIIDEKGYPLGNGVIEYNENMSRKKKTYYSKNGKLANNAYGFAYSIYDYDENGSFVKERRFKASGHPF